MRRYEIRLEAKYKLFYKNQVFYKISGLINLIRIAEILQKYFPKIEKQKSMAKIYFKGSTISKQSFGAYEIGSGQVA